MQLEQLGNDALHMMNTPNTSAESGETPLAKIIRTNDTEQFRQKFLWFCNTTTGGTYDNIQFSADIYYRDNPTNSVNHYHISESRIPTGEEQTMRVTEWVQIDNTGGTGHMPIEVNTRVQAVLVEVLLWRN
jgi:hypothetical protein